MSPFLKMGATFASFQSCGTWPVCNELLNIISSIGEIWWLNPFRTVGGIWSGCFVGFQVGQDILDTGGYLISKFCLLLIYIHTHRNSYCLILYFVLIYAQDFA